MGTVRVTRYERDAEVLPAIDEFERLMDHVSRRAYQLWDEPGRYSGADFDDWLETEHQLLGTPTAETAEMDGICRVTVALPCFMASEIGIAVAPGEMVVRAESVATAGRPAMKVMRRFQFPAPVAVCDVKAEFTGGCLVVTVPKRS